MRTKYFIFALCALVAFASCRKNNDYLPPDWGYDIPDTPLTRQTSLGAYYNVYTNSTWMTDAMYTSLLNIDEFGNVGPSYEYNGADVLARQSEWADQAGLDYFIFPWNKSSSHSNLFTLFSGHRMTSETRVRAIFNFSFSHLSLSPTKMLTDEGVAFDELIDEFKTDLYPKYISTDAYYRLPDGRPLLMMPGVTSANYDYSLFLPAFRREMKEYTAELQSVDPTLPDNLLDFYIIGEVTANWLPPQRHQEVSKLMDGNLVNQWYPSRYYERSVFFYSFTDMAWQNWVDYANGWGNDFIPCIFPEYWPTSTSTSNYGVERSPEGYTSFCNVAKRNMGKHGIIVINSWNTYNTYTPLEPTEEFGDTYLKLTRKNLKL